LSIFVRKYISDIAFSSKKALFKSIKQPGLEFSSPMQIIEFVVDKVIMILRIWKKDSVILSHTLGSEGLLWQLATSYSTGKFMSKLPMIAHLLENHVSLDIGDNVKTRSSFYKSVGRIMFSKIFESFDIFVKPFNHRLQKVKDILMAPNSPPGLIADARFMLRMCLNDLRGVSKSIWSRDNGYLKFFEWFVEDLGYYEWLAQVLEKSVPIGLSIEECWSIVKFAAEFSKNHHRRILFPVTSANGLILFRLTATILIHFGKIVTQNLIRPELQLDRDAMDDKYKSAQL
jgi:hypothetical protein